MNLRSASILLTALACSVAGTAQTSTTSGAIRGTVRSKQSGPVPNATVVLRNLETGFSRTATTTRQGEYQFVFIPVGTYEMTVTAKDLKTTKDPEVRVTLGQTVTMNFSMDSAEASAVVEVIADDTSLNTAQINVQTSINQEFIESIPVNGRNFTDLVQLTPGAASGATSYYTSVEGARGVQNNVQIDGMSFNSRFNGEQRGGTRIPFSFGQDSIKELQVITNTFDVQFGDATGAVVNAVTKTGTNKHTGMAFFVFRPNSLVADVKPVPYDPKGTINDPAVRDRNFTSTQMGFNFGGPIIKDRLHYFINVEASRREESSVPAFGYNETPGNTATDFDAFFGPTGMGSLMVTMPGRTLAEENLRSWTDQQTNLVVMGRLDWTINANHRAALRINSQTYEGLNDIYAGSRRSDIAESGNSSMDFASLSGVLEFNSILSANLINEARLQVSKEKRPTTPNSTISSPVRIANSGSGYYINAGQYYIDPRNTVESTTQIQDTLSLMTGDWVFKAGMDLQFINMENRYLPSGRGNWTFTSYSSANQWFTGTLAGTGVSYSQGYSPLDGVSTLDQQYLAGFAQAQYGGLLNKRLLLSLGVRYTTEQWSDNPNPNAKLQGLDRMPSNDSLDPRFGFSLDLRGDGRTVIRGGYGWFSVGNPGQTTSGAIMNNGINLLSYYVSSSNSSNLPYFAPGGLLSAQSRWSGALSGQGSLTPVAQSDLVTLPRDSVTVTVIDPEAKMSRAQAASLGVEHAFGNGFTLGARATYKEFKNLQYTVNVNLAQLDANGALITDPSNIYNDGYLSKVNRFSNSVANRPYRAIVRGRQMDLSGYGDVMLSKYDGEGSYRNIVLELTRRASNGWGFRGSLTFAKAEDNNSNDRATLNSSNALTENPADPLVTALSDNDRKFRGVLAWWAPAFYGIKVSGSTTYATGLPYSALYYNDINGDGKYLDTVSGRNTYRQPSMKTFDMRITRRFPITRQVALEGTIDVFNVFNWANQSTSQDTYAANPASIPDSYTAVFGQIDRPDNRTREVQFTLKAWF